jgi:hypothetical protein
MTNLYAGNDYNLIIETRLDVSTATSTVVKYKRPDGATGTWNAVLNLPSKTALKTVLAGGDLGSVGKWTVFPQVVISGKTHQGDPVYLNVYDNWRVPV